jgi:hypothetical protein
MPTDQAKNSPKKPLDTIARYGSMGLQMGAVIFLLTWLGIKLDEWLKLSFPAFTLFMALFSVTAALWYFIKDFLPPKK